MEQLLKKCEQIALNPKDTVNDYVKNHNMKAVGVCMPIAPEELVDAAGMLPVGLWGGYDVEYDLAKQYFPAFAASAPFAIMELALNGTYDMLSAIIVPGLSDTLNCLAQNLESGVKKYPTLFFAYPQNRLIPSGIEFLKSELEVIKKKLEKIKGGEITEEDIQKSVKIYNEHKEAMREFSKLAASHPNTVNNRQRAFVFKSAWFMPKKEHTDIVKAINEELRKLPEENFDGKRIVVTGLQMDDPKLLDILESNKLRIVGDYLAHESVQYNSDIPNAADGISRLAEYWGVVKGFSFAYDPKKLRGKLMVELAKERKADGALYALMKFSDNEEYDMPICMKDIEEGKVPVISFEFDQQDGASEQVKTRLQTFAEIL